MITRTPVRKLLSEADRPCYRPRAISALGARRSRLGGLATRPNPTPNAERRQLAEGAGERRRRTPENAEGGWHLSGEGASHLQVCQNTASPTKWLNLLKHLLIVDDEKALREAVAEQLADRGFRGRASR